MILQYFSRLFTTEHIMKITHGSKYFILFFGFKVILNQSIQIFVRYIKILIILAFILRTDYNV